MTAVYFLLPLIPLVQAAGDLGGSGSFTTSTLGALYGIGLAAISVERFPVLNLAWTSDLWAKFVNTQALGSHRGRSEVMQLRWFTRRKLTRWDSPFPLFNGLGAHRVVVVGFEKPDRATGGAWVCVDETASSFLSPRNTTPPLGKCGGYHFWANDPSWWLSLSLKPFTAEVDAGYLNRAGCSEFTNSIDGATAQQCPGSDIPIKIEHLRYTKTMTHYSRMDDPESEDYVDPVLYPKSQEMMRILSRDIRNEVFITTEEVDRALGTIWTFLSPREGRGGERELDRLVHLDSLFEFPEPDFYFRVNLTRIAPSSAFLPHFVETTITMILPWFGITSLVITEQIARKSVWSSLATGSSHYVHSSAYGGELSGVVKNPCSYVVLRGAPSSDLFWTVSIFRLFLILGSYIATIWVQVVLQVTLPTHDDILSVMAARACGLAAVAVHATTTICVFASIRRIQPLIGAIAATVLITTLVALEWRGIVSPIIIGPTVLAAEFISSVIQTALAATVNDVTTRSDGWVNTVNALCTETRVPLILAVPRLAAWFVVRH